MTNINVIKAGGTSVGTPEAMGVIRDETIRIHENALKEDKYAVTILEVSATGEQETGIQAKTTILLEDILKGKNIEANKQEIWDREQRVIPYFGLPEDFNKRNFELLENYLKSGNISDAKRYPLVTTIVGERLKAAHFAKIMNLAKRGIAIFLDYTKTGVITSGGYRNATKTPNTYESIRQALSKPAYHGKILVMGGFMGKDECTRNLTTLEKGGSDTHAVWIGSAMGARHTYIYSDTPLRRADPKIVSDADVIPAVTYGEMEEFIDFGAKILAYNANEAAEESLLELVLRNTFDLKQGETIVSSKRSDGYSGIKGIAACPAVLLALANLPNIPGAYHQVTRILDHYNIGFKNEAGDSRRSSMVLDDPPDNPLEKNIGRALKDISELGLSAKLIYNTTRIGLIGEGIGNDDRGLVAIGQTLKSLNLPMNTISSPYEGIALSIITNQTHVPAVVSGIHNRVFKTPYS